MTVRIVSKGSTVRRPFFRRRKSCPFSGTLIGCRPSTLITLSSTT